MANKDIIKILKTTVQLMELHDENPFKIRSFSTAVFNLEKTSAELSPMSLKELEAIDGIGKSIAASIDEINRTGKLELLDKLIAKTPEGVIEMLGIKGIGPKKIRVIWTTLEVDSIEKLQLACKENKIANLKGFGKKTQENIVEALQYRKENSGKLLYAFALPIAEALKQEIEAKFPEAIISFTGELRRKVEIINSIDILVAYKSFLMVAEYLNEQDYLKNDPLHSGPFLWRGVLAESDFPVVVRLCEERYYYNNLLKHTGSLSHLSTKLASGDNLLKIVSTQELKSEEHAYEIAGIPFIIPEMREGIGEFLLIEHKELPDKLIMVEDIKGIIHNHSTYSDGKHSLREMAIHCKELGFEYFGISDHSQTAFYANGLKEDRILEQHAEIDVLNNELAPFRIFKGIESDILTNGDLDYPTEILEKFDFIVASIHSGFLTDSSKNTERLLKAIRNPFTTILGHPTGRLLLKREGYPIDHKAIIDACAEHSVIIEINANPKRLDMDWKWIYYALSKNVMISVNPDAHSKEEYQNMQFGVAVGRKGGLTKEKTLNCLSLESVEGIFKKKKLA